MKRLIVAISCLLLFLTAGNGLAADDVALQDVENKAQSANAKANGNSSRIQKLEAVVADLQDQIDNFEIGAISGVKVYDDNDNYIGELVDISLITDYSGEPPIAIFYPPLGKFIYFTGAGLNNEAVKVSQYGSPEESALFYESTDCSGPAYIYFKGFATFHFVHAHRTSADDMEYYVTNDFLRPERREFFSTQYYVQSNPDVPYICAEFNYTLLSKPVTKIELPPEFSTGIPFHFK